MDKLKNHCIYRFKTGLISEIKSDITSKASQIIPKFKDMKYLEVFNYYKRGKRLIEFNRIKGEITYISAKDSDNGIWDYICNPLFIEENAITYSTFGDAFYQEGKFTTSDEVTIFKNDKMNIYSAIYIINEMQKNKYKYSYKEKAFKNKWELDTISIPVDENENINWKYMEDTIKNEKYSINLKEI